MRNFQHTIDVLVKAYINDTLEHCNCWACAVGNIVSEANNLEYRRNGNRLNSFRIGEEQVFPMEWFTPMLGGGEMNNNISRKSKEEADSTGYTIHELALIEAAFENCSEDGDYMFNGLMAVVDVLADIHGIDLTVREETKKLFVKA